MKESIGQMFEHEKPNLLGLPARHYECFRLHPVRSNKVWIISFEGNSHSVPTEHSSQSLFLKAYFDHIEITDAKRFLAVRKRLPGGKGKVYSVIFSYRSS